MTIAVYENQFVFYKDSSPSAGDPEYDHIIPVLRIDSNFNDSLYHPDDVIYFSDNGESACINSTDQTVCNDTGVPQFMFNYTVS